MMPINVDTPTARMTEPRLTELLTISGVTRSINVAIIIPRINPMIPPMRHNTTLSTKNCISISRPLAPNARRIAISSVRSVTEIYMTFITPIPAIKSDIPATAATK